MRRDFNKLLCERARPQSYRKFKEVRNSKHIKEFEGHLLTDGVAYGYDHKQFNENLGPLRKFLRSCVGQRWDDVYSEICKTFDKRKTIDAHIFLHLFQDVEIKTDVRDGKVVYMEDRSYLQKNRGWIPIEECSSEFYVHPVSSILTKVRKHEKRRYWKIHNEKLKEEKAQKERDINGRHYEKIKGCWFDVEITKNTIAWTDLKGVKHTRVDEYRKQRQLSNKELKKLALKND